MNARQLNILPEVFSRVKLIVQDSSLRRSQYLRECRGGYVELGCNYMAIASSWMVEISILEGNSDHFFLSLRKESPPFIQRSYCEDFDIASKTFKAAANLPPSPIAVSHH